MNKKLKKWMGIGFYYLLYCPLSNNFSKKNKNTKNKRSIINKDKVIKEKIKMIFFSKYVTIDYKF